MIMQEISNSGRSLNRSRPCLCHDHAGDPQVQFLSTAIAACMDAVNEEAAFQNHVYIPEGDYEEKQDVPCVDIPSTDSTEVWLIQEPMNQLVRDDFHGKTISLRMDGDKLGTLTSSSGKSYELMKFTSQEPDATTFLRGASDCKKGVKISHRVCLVYYPDSSDLVKAKTPITSSSQKTGGSQSSMRSRPSAPPSWLIGGSSGARTSHDTLTATHTIGGRSVESTKHSSRKRSKIASSLPTGRASGRNSQVSLPESGVTEGPLPDEAPGPSSTKKRKNKP